VNTPENIRAPRVSVVIPPHNAEHFISTAIRSALAPSFPDVEVLVPVRVVVRPAQPSKLVSSVAALDQCPSAAQA